MYKLNLLEVRKFCFPKRFNRSIIYKRYGTHSGLFIIYIISEFKVNPEKTFIVYKNVSEK